MPLEKENEKTFLCFDEKVNQLFEMKGFLPDIDVADGADDEATESFDKMLNEEMTLTIALTRKQIIKIRFFFWWRETRELLKSMFSFGGKKC